MTRATIVRSLALGLVAAVALAMPIAKADPPKATMLLINSTGHDVVVEFDAPRTKAWTRLALRPGAEHLVYEIVGPFRLVGHVTVGNARHPLEPVDVVLGRTSFKRLRIERGGDGRYYFGPP